ncbi:hypothetical protein KR009_010145 [Drosophila setifemur]|nr:hypothetical protein KR009_010145 [Drosophila setifemur]
MARSELDKKVKRQDRKRKHEAPANAVQSGSDDEVASKSVILDQKVAPKDKPSKKRQNEGEVSISKKRNKKAATEEQVVTGEGQEPAPQKPLKRKQKLEATEALKEKRSKRDQDSEEEGEDSQPTAAQLHEAAKPENANAVVTVRQKKKQKHQQRLQAQRAQNTNKEAELNKEYLQKWKESRDEWKFTKLRQISIQQTAFDAEKLDAELWPTALEYLASSQGAARSKISKIAEEEIQKVDKQCENLEDETERQLLIESTRYQRARDLLQNFD